MVAQLFNVSIWKCFQLGGMILSVTGFFQWRFVIDHIRERFLIFCTFIGLLVVYYSIYYILNSEVNLFRGVIILFITRILILTSRSNIMTIFIGWEGVGIISFVLIAWFISREKAISASFYAFIFNRFADFFFLVLLLWEVRGQHRLFYFQLIRDPSYYNNVTLGVVVILRISFWIATAGKSSQFVFHPWLTLAMEGPTPVRRLLHSRTIVVAGVYLLLKLHPLVISLNWLELNNVIILSRVVTMVFTSLWAINQVDIKKIIALSTTSQLRLIIVMCCIGQYDLAFLHIILHGFFKALLFLGSGITIHNNSINSQDITKLNLLLKRSTFLHTVFIIGVLGLLGAPFIGSFHSKHFILDITQHIGSLSSYDGYLAHQLGCISTLAYVGLYFSPVITLGYSLKLLAFISQKPSLVILSSSYIKGTSNDLKIIIPLSLLATFRFVVGLVISQPMGGGVTTFSSREDAFYSLFILVLFLGSLYYILLTQTSLGFLYNLSGSIVKSNILHIRNLLILFSFQLIEQLILKKGLKLLIPGFNILKYEQKFLMVQCFKLESCLLTYLHNLAIAVLTITLFFIFFY